MRDDFYFILFCSGLILFGFLMVCIAFGLDAYSCHSRSRMMGLVADYGPVQGCMVQVGSRYAPLEYIRIVDDKVIIQGDGE